MLARVPKHYIIYITLHYYGILQLVLYIYVDNMYLHVRGGSLTLAQSDCILHMDGILHQCEHTISSTCTADIHQSVN